MLILVSSDHFVEYEDSSGGICLLDAFFMGVGIHVPYTMIRKGEDLKFVQIGKPYVCRHEMGHPGIHHGCFCSEEYLPKKVLKAANSFLAKKGGRCGKRHAA